MKEETKRLIKKFLEGVEEDSLRRGEVWSLDRFKANVGKIGVDVIEEEEPEVKGRLIRGIKAAGLQLIATIPVITPIITAFLEVVTSEDLSGKMDSLGDKMDSLGERMDGGFKELGDKMDKMLTLQGKTLQILEERLH